MSPKVSKHFFDIHEAATELRDFVAGKSFDDFQQERLLQAAVERKFEIIGEALNRLSREAPAQFAAFPDASRIVGMRNIIAHGYDSIDLNILWAAASLKLPTVIAHAAAQL